MLLGLTNVLTLSELLVLNLCFLLYLYRKQVQGCRICNLKMWWHGLIKAWCNISTLRLRSTLETSIFARVGPSIDLLLTSIIWLCTLFFSPELPLTSIDLLLTCLIWLCTLIISPELLLTSIDLLLTCLIWSCTLIFPLSYHWLSLTCCWLA